MIVKRIAVGSTNPVKINAVKMAIKAYLPKVKVISYKANSLVSDQPKSHEETRQGSINRSKETIKNTDADIAIGLEGGVDIHKGFVDSIVYCTAISSSGQTQSVHGLGFTLPEKIARPIKEGEEMGPAMDKILGSVNIKKKQGAIGVLTNGWVTRTEGYSHLVKLALGRLLTLDWQ